MYLCSFSFSFSFYLSFNLSRSLSTLCSRGQKWIALSTRRYFRYFLSLYRCRRCQLVVRYCACGLNTYNVKCASCNHQILYMPHIYICIYQYIVGLSCVIDSLFGLFVYSPYVDIRSIYCHRHTKILCERELKVVIDGGGVESTMCYP